MWTLAPRRSDDEEIHQYPRTKQSPLSLKIWSHEECAKFADPWFAALCQSAEIRAVVFRIFGYKTNDPSIGPVAKCGGGVMSLSTSARH